MPAQVLTTAPRFAPAPRRLTPLARVSAALDLWQQRRALAALDDARLADLGLTREQARTEANRPLWDAPSHWF
jgi:uncharacterized protein YjiS (DUF1127 family)